MKPWSNRSTGYNSICLPNRMLPKKLAPVEYDSCYTVRQVRHNGTIKWKGQLRLCVSSLSQRTNWPQTDKRSRMGGAL